MQYTHKKVLDVLVIGAGPSGLGTAIALKEFGVKKVMVVDASTVGASFLSWPKETRVISPSFTGHQFGLLDLNAITYATSPAFTLGTEHPTGEEYAEYLRTCVNTFNIDIQEKTKILSIQKDGDLFICKTTDNDIYAKYIVSAVGEFMFPKKDHIQGSGFCRHTSSISEYSKMDGSNFIMIGGYESGIDAAIHLSRAGKKVTVIDAGMPWNLKDSDPSVVISPFTSDRLHEELPKGNITLVSNQHVEEVTFENGMYTVVTNDSSYSSDSQPLTAFGFSAHNDVTSALFSFTKEELPEITNEDESTKLQNAFLVGPKVKHGNVIFCFIYKYRERFGVVADTIAKRLGVDTKDSIAFYKSKNMYLDDLSCCEDVCVC